MIPENEIKAVVERCNEGIRVGSPYTTAIGIPLLTDAEKAGLTDFSWRKEVDTRAAEKLLSSNSEKIEERWLENFEQLKQILDYGGRLIYEEMTTVLDLRDHIEAYPRYMNRDPSDQRGQIDGRFTEILELNKDMVRETREETVINIGRYLPGYWWWRVDLEGFPTESDMVRADFVAENPPKDDLNQSNPISKNS